MKVLPLHGKHNPHYKLCAEHAKDYIDYITKYRDNTIYSLNWGMLDEDQNVPKMMYSRRQFPGCKNHKTWDVACDCISDSDYEDYSLKGLNRNYVDAHTNGENSAGSEAEIEDDQCKHQTS